MGSLAETDAERPRLDAHQRRKNFYKYLKYKRLIDFDNLREQPRKNILSKMILNFIFIMV